MRVMKNKSFYESFQENLLKEDNLLLENDVNKGGRKLKEDVAELTPSYEGRNSYYGKAFVETNGNKKTLTSYKTKIMTIEDGKITMLCDEDALTQTTLRHIREFLKQNNIEPLTRKELVNLINGEGLKESGKPYIRRKSDGKTLSKSEVREMWKEAREDGGWSVAEYPFEKYLADIDETQEWEPVNLKESDEAFEEYEDFSDGDIIKDVIDNYKEITGKELKDIFNYEDTGNDADAIFKQSVIEDTAQSVIDYLESKGLDRRRIDDLLYKLDDELIPMWDNYAPENFKEQDETYRVNKVGDEDREYSIVDITELTPVADGDVQAPIDISELLVNVDSKLSESYGSNWGEINFQSTRFNNDTKDSNALFELSVGDKTYLMSMLLEENGTVLKVNNTKGQTIFKRKTKDIVGLTESYIKQFIPKEAKEVPEVIKHINADLHDAYNFLLLQIDLGKDVPKGEKEAFNKYLQSQIYAFVAEVSDEIKASEPTEEDKLELPSFDKMVEEIFGKQWVKKEPEQKKLELDGVEELKEENYVKKYSNKLDTMSDKELYDAWKEVKDEPDEKGSQEEIEYTLASDALSEIEGELCRRGFMDENSNKTEKWSELEELKESVYDKIEVGNEVYWVGAGNEISATGKVVDLPTEGRMTVKWDDGDVNTYDVDHPSIIRAELYDNSFNECDKSKIKESNVDDALLRMKQANDEVNAIMSGSKDGVRKKRLVNNIEMLVGEYLNGIYDGYKEPFNSDEELVKYVYDNLFDTVSDGQGTEYYGKGISDDLKYLGKDYIVSEIKRIGHEEGIVKESAKLKEADEPEEKPTEEPKNGLGTGNATFARKPSNISDVESKSKSFTSGDSSYLICSKEKISKDEFDDLQENFTTPNKWCREFKPIDTENYAFNVIEFSCPDYSYKLLVDPSDSDYCKYVSKVGE